LPVVRGCARTCVTSKMGNPARPYTRPVSGPIRARVCLALSSMRFNLWTELRAYAALGANNQNCQNRPVGRGGILGCRRDTGPRPRRLRTGRIRPNEFAARYARVRQCHINPASRCRSVRERWLRTPRLSHAHRTAGNCQTPARVRCVQRTLRGHERVLSCPCGMAESAATPPGKAGASKAILDNLWDRCAEALVKPLKSVASRRGFEPLLPP
jgi:hypothetical protein